MKKIIEIIQKNRLYTVLFIFVVTVNLMSAFGGKVDERESAVETGAVKGEEGGAAPGRIAVFDEETAQARQEKITALVKENPVLYFFIAILNLAILFVMFIGIMLDIYFLARWLKKKPLEITVTRRPEPRWDISDIARVVLIFLSCGYVFALGEMLGIKFFPIFGNENFRIISSTAIINLVGVGVVFYFITKKYGQKIAAIGFTARRGMKCVFYGLVGYVALIPILFTIMLGTYFVAKYFKYHPPVQEIVQVFMEEKEVSVLWISALFAAVFGPIAEETFFRGFMYNAIKRRVGVFKAVVITAAIFSLLHTHAVGFLPIMALGILLSYLYERTGSLVSSITVHIAHNLGMVTLVFVVRSIGG